MQQGGIKMSISKRLILTLLVALGAMLLLGGFGIWQLSQAQQRFEYVSGNTFPSIQEMGKAQHAVTDLRLGILKTLLATTQEQKDSVSASMTAADKNFDESIASYLANDISNDTDRQLLEADKAAMANYRGMRDKAFSELKAGQHDQAVKTLLVDGVLIAKTLNQALDDHAAFNFKQADDLTQTNKAAYNEAVILSLIMIAAAFIASGILGSQLFRIIKSGLRDMQSAMENVNKSLDFTHRAPVARMDEIGLTATAFNQLLDRLQDNLKSILSGAHQVAKASQEMAQTAGEVSSASAAQSEASANMAATVEQMTVSINHVADQARSTQALSREAGTLAHEGSEIISQTIKDIHEISAVVTASASSIRELETNSGQVSSVINVIREIADQTNLLALNAAIEAARAGEQGRGFAVVADEVRKLAERTARSTQEIATTIQAMVTLAQHSTTQMQSAEQLVETGVHRADLADQAIKRIGETSSGTANMVSEISTAISEQGEASNNIATQVERTAQMSEQASAAAQHTAANAGRLDTLAREQIATLSRYTL
jgi:methyl-accepting chemotaxis protein